MVSGIKDHIETKLFVNKRDSSKQYETTNKLHTFFTNKGIEITNLLKLLTSKNIHSKMPSDMSKDDIPMVTYKLQNPGRSKLFDHKKIVKSFEISPFIQNASILVLLKFTIYRS